LEKRIPGKGTSTHGQFMGEGRGKTATRDAAKKGKTYEKSPPSKLAGQGENGFRSEVTTKKKDPRGAF